MNVLKTIVATAAIVFALTTAAVAGVQHYGGGDAGAHVAQAASPVQAHPAAPGSVTLSAQQFAALLRTVRHDGDGTPDRHAARTHAKTWTHDHARQQTRTHATSGQSSGGATTTSGHTSAHDGTHHSGTHHGGTQDGGSHDGGHDGGGTHDGGHDGGCD